MLQLTCIQSFTYREPVVPFVAAHRYSWRVKKQESDPLREEVRRVLSTVTTLASRPEELRQFELVTMELGRRILTSFESHPEGAAFRVGWTAMVSYFSALGYWRGYKDAKRHYAVLGAADRVPHGREHVRRAVEKLLEKDLKASAKQICEQLDVMDREQSDSRRLSASFDTAVGRKQKTVHVGRAHDRPWSREHREPYVKMMISRLRKRMKAERNAKEWMERSEKALN